MLERVAMPFSRGSSRLRDRAWVSCVTDELWAERRINPKSRENTTLLTQRLLSWKIFDFQLLKWSTAHSHNSVSHAGASGHTSSEDRGGPLSRSEPPSQCCWAATPSQPLISLPRASFRGSQHRHFMEIKVLGETSKTLWKGVDKINSPLSKRRQVQRWRKTNTQFAASDSAQAVFYLHCLEPWYLGTPRCPLAWFTESQSLWTDKSETWFAPSELGLPH